MTKRLLFIPLLLLGGCLLGCSYKQVGTSEWGWKQETRWSFYQETKPHSEDEQASFNVDLEALVNHFIDLRKDEEPSE